MKKIIDRIVKFMNSVEEDMTDETSTNTTSSADDVADDGGKEYGPQDQKTGKKRSPSNDPAREDGISTKMAVIDTIVNALMPIRHVDNSCASLQLYIINCPSALAIHAIVRHKDFEQEIRRSISDADVKLGTSWKWQFFTDMVAPANALKIADGLFLNIVYIGDVTVKAKITALKGFLDQKEYILGAENIEKEKYNIGRGANPQLDNGSFHKNDIVITESEREEMRVNLFVSRAHAYIIKRKNGFALKVLPGGCALNGNRTRIFRDGKPMDLTDPYLEFLLKNEDQIELGKNVILSFEFINS